MFQHFKKRNNVKLLTGISLRKFRNTEREDFLKTEDILPHLNRFGIPINPGHIEAPGTRRGHEIPDTTADIEQAPLLGSARIRQKEFVSRFERWDFLQAPRIEVLVPNRSKPLEGVPKLYATGIALEKEIPSNLAYRCAHTNCCAANGAHFRGLDVIRGSSAAEKGLRISCC